MPDLGLCNWCGANVASRVDAEGKPICGVCLRVLLDQEREEDEPLGEWDRWQEGEDAN